MAWKTATNPNAPATPRVHSPARCMGCGHDREDHAEEVGCVVPGGTKWVDNEHDPPFGACSCDKFIPVEETVNE